MEKQDKIPMMLEFIFGEAAGAALKRLQRLQWGQIEPDEAGAWVRWRPEAQRVQLPGDVWEAVQSYLAASGRLAGMRDGAYIFPPLVDILVPQPGSRAEDWREGRCQSVVQILKNLKLYGRLAKIPEDKLNLHTLHLTAARLRLDEGATLEEMQAFLDSQALPKSTRNRLRLLPQLPPDEGGGEQGGGGAATKYVARGRRRANGVRTTSLEGEGAENEPPLPVRVSRPFKPGEGMTHGFYAQNQPKEAVRAVIAEDIHGVDEQICGLRMLGRGLLGRLEEARSSGEAAQLGDAYSILANRLAEMIQAEKKLSEAAKAGSWVDEFLANLDEYALERGEPPWSEAIRKETLESDPELSAAARRLEEEIASLRYVLRNAFRLAQEAGQTQEYVRLVEVYGSGCVRLVHLLKKEPSDNSRLEVGLLEARDWALNHLQEEWGLHR